MTERWERLDNVHVGSVSSQYHVAIRRSFIFQVISRKLSWIWCHSGSIMWPFVPMCPRSFHWKVRATEELQITFFALRGTTCVHANLHFSSCSIQLVFFITQSILRPSFYHLLRIQLSWIQLEVSKDKNKWYDKKRYKLSPLYYQLFSLCMHLEIKGYTG